MSHDREIAACEDCTEPREVLCITKCDRKLDGLCDECEWFICQRDPDMCRTERRLVCPDGSGRQS